MKYNKEKIRQAYSYGDSCWLDEIWKQTLSRQEDPNYEDIVKLLSVLYKMNFILVETETEKYLADFNGQVQDLYSEMKIKLTKLIDYEEMWEEV